MRYKLIALDLDGTLLHDGKNILEENVKAIHYAINKGVTVIIATGRVTTSGRAFAKRLGLESYIIASNGARVFDLKEKKVIFEDGLDIEDAKSIANYFESFGIYYHAYVDDIMYARYMRDTAIRRAIEGLEVANSSLQERLDGLFGSFEEPDLNKGDFVFKQAASHQTLATKIRRDWIVDSV